MIRFLAILLFLAASPAYAQECAPAKDVLEHIGHAVPIQRVVRLNAEQTASANAWFNAQPPVSNDAYDLALVIAHAGGRMGLLMGKGDDICAAYNLKKEEIPSLMEAISNPSKSLNPV